MSPLGRWGNACLAAAAVVGLYGCYRLYESVELSARGCKATASVFYMDHLARDPNDPLDPWHKEARFSTRAYRTVTFVTDQGLRVVDQSCLSFHNIHRDNSLVSPKIVPRETSAELIYDPADPNRFLFTDGWSLWGFATTCVSTALAWFGYAWAVGSGWIVPPTIRFRLRSTKPVPTALCSASSPEQA